MQDSVDHDISKISHKLLEYRLAKGWRIASYVFCAGFTGLAIWLVFLGTAHENGLPERLSFYAGAGALLFLVYYMFRDTRYGKLIIGVDQLTLISPFRVTTVQVTAITGYQITENYLIITARDRRHEKIKVSRYLEKQHEILDWLNSNTVDLDELETEAEENEILRNEELGLFTESRIARWQQAKKVAQVSKWIGWILLIWILFFPKPYLLSVSLCILFPMAALGMCYVYRDLMKGGDRDKSAYPSMAEAFILPGMGLALRALFDFNILDHTNMWTPVILLTALLAFAYLFPTGGLSPRKTADYIFMILFPIFAFAYSYGSAIVINCAFDKSVPAQYRTSIASKHFSKGRTTTYYLDLHPWGSLREIESVKVSRDEYDQAGISDPVTVIQYKGVMRIPWIEVQL